MIPLDFDIRPFARLAALGALAVSAGAFALWLFVLFVTRSTATGGIDATHSLLAAMAVGMICAAVIAVHLAFARQLLRYAKRGSE
ncbi:MAG: hypothetical protein ACT4R6_10080 [Gemmatimonadaceae bacterium]